MEVEEAAIPLLGALHFLILRKWIPMTKLAGIRGVIKRLKSDSTLGDPPGMSERTLPRLPLAGTSRKAMDPPQMVHHPVRNPTSILETVGEMAITTAIVIEENDRTVNLFTHVDTWTSMTNTRYPAMSGAALAYRVGTWGWPVLSTNPTSRNTRERFGNGMPTWCTRGWARHSSCLQESSPRPTSRNRTNGLATRTWINSTDGSTPL